MLNSTRKFLREVKLELGKATWPWDPKLQGPKRYRELVDSTVIVVIAMLLLGAYVSFGDYVLITLVEALVALAS